MAILIAGVVIWVVVHLVPRKVRSSRWRLICSGQYGNRTKQFLPTLTHAGLGHRRVQSFVPNTVRYVKSVELRLRNDHLRVA